MAVTATADAVRLADLPPASGRAGFGGALRSEFTKIRSVRSTYWTLMALLAISIGLGAAITGGTAAHWNQMNPGDQATFDSTQASLGGLFYLGELVITVLGAMVLTSEYSTGMIRTSLTSMPRRGVVYAAKAVVFTCIALVVTFVAAFVSFFLGQALMASTHHGATLSEPNVLRAIIGSVLYVSVCGLFAYAIGAIIRHTAGTITTVIGLLFVIPILAHLLPQSWFWDIHRWLPSAAGEALSVTVGQPPDHLFSAWGQFAVLGVYTAVLLIIGGILFRKRDA